MCATFGMRPYPKDLSLRVLAAVYRGILKPEAARVFSVPTPATIRYLRLPWQTSDVRAQASTGPPPRKGAALQAVLVTQEARGSPDLALSEHCDLFEEQEGVRVSTAMMSGAGPRST